MLQKLSSPKAKKILSTVMCLAVLSCFFVVGCCAADTTSDLGAKEAAQGVMDIIHAQLNFTTVMEVIGVGLASAVAIFLGWWGIRKLVRIVMNAFKKGKVSI